jgi:hypothetical protein
MGTLFRKVIKRILIFGLVLILSGSGMSGRNAIHEIL